VVCCPVGTGGTMAGIISSLKEDQKAIGFSVLKAPGYLEQEIKNLLLNLPTFQFSTFEINEGYHFGGYAKHTPELLQFIENF
jgi:1-aminocyclopropane-1-carboxylate deaminase